MARTWKWILLLSCVVGGSAGAQTEDLTSKIEALTSVGRPEENPYARNVWDMRTFGGRIYVAHGTANAPLDLVAYDPMTGTLVKEHQLAPGYVDFFRVLDGKLLAATQAGLHRLDGKTWSPFPVEPAGARVHDLAASGTTIWAALGTPDGGTVARLGEVARRWKVPHARTLLPIGGVLYASTAKGELYMLTSAGFERMEEGLFPGVRGKEPVFAVRQLAFRRQTVYLGARAAPEPGWVPVGLFVARSLDVEGLRGLLLPGLTPRDLLTRGDILYVLASSDKGPDRGAKAPPREPGTWVWVVATKNFAVWEGVVAFRAETFARSFELLKGDFYFGMGCDADRPSPASGKVLRLRAADWKAPKDAWLY
jgi:hypothetical protein